MSIKRVTVTMKSGYLEEIMTDEVREYAERKIWESGIMNGSGALSRI